jgi:HlyD family type I secretion membrane fusion protein
MADEKKKKVGFFQRLLVYNRVSREEYEQLQDEDAPPPKLNIRFADSRRIILAGLLVVGVFFGAGGIWASVAEITGAVIAQGEVRVDTERKTVQHLEGGIIREILVRNGDQVTKGQPLLILDDTRVGAAVEQLQLQIAALHLADARMVAERDGLSEPRWPARPPEVGKKDFADLLANEKKVFSSRRQSLSEQVDLLRKQIEQMNEQITGLSERILAEEQIIAALQEEADAKESLLAENYIDKTAVLTLRRALAEHIGTKGQLRGSIAEVRGRIAEYELRIEATKSKFLEEVTAGLSKNQQQVFDLLQQLEPRLDAQNRLSVVAPVDGEVVALNVHSIGGVITPGQPLLDIVPTDNPLIVECKIMVKDITHVFKGQHADVQLLAFKQRTTPKIPGKVVYISADRLLQKTNYGEVPSYEVHVELDKEELEENNLYLTAGMPATVFIRTDPRTLLDYLLEPILVNADHALREI